MDILHLAAPCRNVPVTFTLDRTMNAMAALKLPPHLAQKLGPEMKMDVHWVDVKLRDGRIFTNMVVRGGAYITGRASDANGEGELPFGVSDVANVRRHSMLGGLWPFWK